jgi:methanogenesis imperfect marker protein 11
MFKLQVGVDDTDKPGVGATWSLANEIAYELGKQKGIEYLNHTLIQLYPGTPDRTTNCVATVLSFAVLPEKLEYIKRELTDRFSELTQSEQTGLAFMVGISIPKKLIRFSARARKQVVTLEQAKKMANELEIELVSIASAGDRGLIGAVAGLGYSEKQDHAVRPMVKIRDFS